VVGLPEVEVVVGEVVPTPPTVPGPADVVVPMFVPPVVVAGGSSLLHAAIAPNASKTAKPKVVEAFMPAHLALLKDELQRVSKSVGRVSRR
jgi:hypothetical protein